MKFRSILITATAIVAMSLFPRVGGAVCPQQPVFDCFNSGPLTHVKLLNPVDNSILDSITLTGTTCVQVCCSDPIDSGRISTTTRIYDMHMYGTSTILGPIDVYLDNQRESYGKIITCTDNTTAESNFKLYYIIVTHAPPPMDTLFSAGAFLELHCGSWNGTSFPPTNQSYKDPRLTPIYDNTPPPAGPNLICFAMHQHEVGDTTGVTQTPPPPTPCTPPKIPTLTEWGLIIFSVLLLGWMAWAVVRRRRGATVRMQ